MRQQVEHGDAEHQAADKAHQQLHLAVRKAHQPGERAAAQGGGEDANAIECQKQNNLHSPIVIKTLAVWLGACGEEFVSGSTP